jgi:hypothetical protein
MRMLDRSVARRTNRPYKVTHRYVNDVIQGLNAKLGQGISIFNKTMLSQPQHKWRHYFVFAFCGCWFDSLYSG